MNWNDLLAAVFMVLAVLLPFPAGLTVFRTSGLPFGKRLLASVLLAAAAALLCLWMALWLFAINFVPLT